MTGAFSQPEYCAPVWCCSAHTHLTDSVPHDALHIVTGCLRLTSTDHLPILSGIQPAELCRLGATSLANLGSLDPDHILYGLLSRSSDARQERLRCKHPFVPDVRNLLNNLAGLGIHASQGTNYRWDDEYCKKTFTLCVFISRTSARSVGINLP